MNNKGEEMNSKVSNRRGERGAVRFLAMGAGIAALLVTGCGTATGSPGGSSTASSSPVPTVASPTPTPTARPASSSFQALVQYNFPDTAVASGTTVRLYSSDTGVAQVVLIFPADSGGAQFIPDNRIAFISGISWLDSSDLSGGTRREELNLNPDSTVGASWIGAYDWSQNGTLAYLAVNEVGGTTITTKLVIRPAMGTAVTVALVDTGVSAVWGNSVAFAPDGNSVLLVDDLSGFTPGRTTGQSSVQVRGLDGTLRFAAPWDGKAATMPSDAVWGTDGRVYFWDSQGVSVADPSTGLTRTLLPGVRWYDPSVSPDGRYIVFAVRDEQGLPTLELLDTATGNVVPGFGISAASHATFVSDNVIWYHQEPACSGDGCTRTGWSTEPTGQTTQVLDPLLSFDLSTHSAGSVGMAGVVTDSRVLTAG